MQASGQARTRAPGMLPFLPAKGHGPVFPRRGGGELCATSPEPAPCSMCVCVYVRVHSRVYVCEAGRGRRDEQEEGEKPMSGPYP